APPPPAATTDAPLEEVVVTGSRLSQADTSSPNPVLVVDSSELQHAGAIRTEDLLNSLPQANSGLTLGANGASVAPLTGTATADLRGIGAFRTLVLVDGIRPAPGDPVNPSADLNAVPSALIRRVEVLTGGASAIYGSDAIAGVVNFILDKEFTGLKVDLQGGINGGSNSRSDLQAMERASGVNPRTGSVYDGANQDLSVVFGRDLLAGRAHLTAYAGYRHVQGVFGASRDFSACTLTETGAVPPYQCLLDGTTAAGQFAANGGAGPALTLDAANPGSFRPLTGTDLYNPAPYQMLQRPDTRVSAGAFASYRFSDAATAYGEALYTNDRTQVYYEPAGTTPTGAGLNVFGVNCNNPLLSASQINDLCTQYGLLSTDIAQVAIGRRNVEGAGLTTEYQHRSVRFVAGLKGDLNAAWSYNASLTYGRVQARQLVANDLSLARVSNGLDVVNVAGTPTCQSVVDSTDPACVPYNIFSLGGVTAKALNYVTAGGSESGYASRTIATGQLIGHLGQYGIESPLAKHDVGVALGAEYRKEQASFLPDAALASGDLLITGGANPLVGAFHVTEVFAELKAPLIEQRPLAQRLTFSASDRFASYKPQGNVNAFGVGLEWQPIHALTLRGSYNRAVRAPNVLELYSPQLLGQSAVTDPCAGVPSATLAQCQLTGVTPAQYGNIAPQSTVNVVTGGNPNLNPEIADTLTMGVVLMPMPNLLFSADYWRIRIKRYLGSIPVDYTLSTCLNTGDPAYCSLIHRDASGSLSTGNGASAGRVIATRFNTGSYGNTGVDFAGRYRLDLGFLGARTGNLLFSFTGSLALNNPINVTPGGTEFDCTGYFGPNCSGAGPTSPVPRWRHRLRATWHSNFADGFEASLNWRHIGHMNSEFTSSNPNLSNPANVFAVDAAVGSFNYFDLDASVRLADHLTLRGGVNNLTDRQPPVVGFNANPLLVDGNMVAGMYDTLGRYVFIGATANF
ncbi:MAG: TonB-dependent receptor, partial [Gammaproteobacteria bacterium]|nr:TonB-dependent receptor [Gammaproteobacteria bacterium]